MFVSPFLRFLVFSPNSRYYIVYFSYFTFFTASLHIPSPTVFFVRFVLFSVFLTIFHNLPCELLLFLVCQFSHHIPGLQCLCLIFHILQFSHHNSGPIECVSHFARFSVFLAKFHVLCYEFLIILIVSFLAIFQVLQ